jgi:hypothetical protein
MFNKLNINPGDKIISNANPILQRQFKVLLNDTNAIIFFWFIKNYE